MLDHINPAAVELPSGLVFTQPVSLFRLDKLALTATLPEQWRDLGRLPNEIINLTVHEHRKGTAGLEVRLRETPLPVNDLTQKVVDDLHDLYCRRSAKAHGSFATDATQFPTRTFLQAYINAGTTGPAFAALTRSLMTTLDVRARTRPNAGGGHVLFAHFVADSKHFLLVAIVNEKWGARLTQSLDLQEAPHIDMEGFRFAGRIGISGWQDGDRRYIGFLKGKGAVAEYFKEFLGCEETILAKQDTQTLTEVFQDFAADRSLVGDSKEHFLRRASEICSRSARSKIELDFSALANELVPEEPDALLSKLNDPARGLTDGFVPNAGVLGRMVKFEGRTPDWSLEFDRRALNNGSVEFDAENETLLIRGLPSDLLAKLRRDAEG